MPQQHVKWLCRIGSNGYRLVVQDFPLVAHLQLRQIQGEVVGGDQTVVGHGEGHELTFSPGQFRYFGRSGNSYHRSRDIGLEFGWQHDFVGVGQFYFSHIPCIGNTGIVEHGIKLKSFAAANGYHFLSIIMTFGGILYDIFTLGKIGENHIAVFIRQSGSYQLIGVSIVDFHCCSGKHRLIGTVQGIFIAQADGDIALVAGDKGIIKFISGAISVFRINPDAAGVWYI